MKMERKDKEIRFFLILVNDYYFNHLRLVDLRLRVGSKDMVVFLFVCCFFFFFFFFLGGGLREREAALRTKIKKWKKCESVSFIT